MKGTMDYLRRFIPKSKSIKDITDRQIEYYCDVINALPIKILGYKSPEQLFDEQLDKIYSIF